MQSKHTPTPWEMDVVRTAVGLAYRIGSGEMLVAGKGCCIIYDDYPPDVSERKANAIHIVKCVNAHDALVEALTYIRDMANAKAVDALHSDTFTPERIAELCNAALSASKGADKNNNQEMNND